MKVVVIGAGPGGYPAAFAAAAQAAEAALALAPATRLIVCLVVTASRRCSVTCRFR